MAQSPEYPDLKWVPPKSWTNANRTYVQLIVIHTTEGSAHGQSAEDGAAYNTRRTDGTSAHYFVDSDSIVHCVRTNDQAHTARSQGNRRGIQYELCTRAASSPATWANGYHQAMLARAAKQAARDVKRWSIPVRHLTVAQVAAGAKGFCGHWDITRAFPQDNGSHTDPGKNFPWSQFLDMVRAELEEDMPITPAEFDKIRTIVRAEAADVAKQVMAFPVILPDERKVDVYTILRWLSAGEEDTRKQVLAAITNNDDVDEAALVAALAPAVAALVVASLPAGSDQISQEEVNIAVERAFHAAFAD